MKAYSYDGLRCIQLIAAVGSAVFMAGCAENKGNIFSSEIPEIQQALDHGASIDQKEEDENFLLSCAGEPRRPSLRTPLIAAAFDSPSLVPFLIEHGADANQADVCGNTALGWAIQREAYNRIPCENDECRYLLDHGANPKHRHSTGFPDYLLVKGFLRTHPDSALQSALGRAMSGGKDAAHAREVEDAAVADAAKLNPRPAASDEAKRLMAKGKAFTAGAKSPDDFGQAAAEMKKALALAPSWATGYFNAALAEEGAGLWADAAHHLKDYLTLNPDADDKAKVLDKIAALEVREEKGDLPDGE
jgi:hypothetical protein